MREVKIVRQQYKNDKEYFTGENGQGFIIKCAKTGEVVETAPTLAQAEATAARFQAEKPEAKFEIISAGDEDAKGHAQNSPFRFFAV